MKQFRYILVALLCLLAFLIPQGREFSPILIGVIAFASLVYFILRPKIKSGEMILPFLPLIAFYVLHIIGITYSSSPGQGFFDLEVKLSFIVLPMIIFFLGKEFWKPSYFYWILASFVFGTALWSLHGMYRIYADHQNLNDFKAILSGSYYSYINKYMYHTTYLAIYHCFSLGILLMAFAKFRKLCLRWYILILWLLLVLYMIASVILFGSKAGILSLGLVIGFVFLYEVLWGKNYWVFLYYPLVFGSFAMMAFTLFPSSVNRLEGMIMELTSKKMVDSSTRVRIQVWESSMKSISAHPCIGSGTGSNKSSVLKHLSPQDKQALGDSYFDAHNQYLHTTVCLGILGLFILLMIFILPFLLYKKQIAMLYFLFALLFVFTMVTESMLEQQLGIVFFSFFYCTLIAQSFISPKCPRY